MIPRPKKYPFHQLCKDAGNTKYKKRSGGDRKLIKLSEPYQKQLSKFLKSSVRRRARDANIETRRDDGKLF